MSIQGRDKSTGSTQEITDEGYLKGMATVTAAGVRTYNRFPMPVLFSEETVFHVQTAKSLQMKPITLGHPLHGGDVDTANYRRLSVGHVGDSVTREGDMLKVPFLLTDANAIRKVQDGLAEVSIGYDFVLENSKGQFNGADYGLRTKGPLAINHVAIVDRGRAGRKVRIQDRDSTMTEAEIKALVKTAIAESGNQEIEIDKLAGSIVTQLRDSADVDATSQQELDEARQEIVELKAKIADSEPNMAKQIVAAARDRADIMLKVQPMLTDEQQADIADKDMKTILQTALKGRVKALDTMTMSEDGLRGALEVVIANRQEGQDGIRAKSNSVLTKSSDMFSRPFRSFLDIPKTRGK